MAWHKIHNAYYSDSERNAMGRSMFGILVDLGLPALCTYFGVTQLSAALEQNYSFFVVHTTTAKLLYILTGIVIFSATYSFRKRIIFLSFLAVAGTILVGVGMSFLGWLMK